MFEEIDFIFCHKNCFDGSASAVLLKHYSQYQNGTTPTIVEYWHEQDEKMYQFPDVNNKHVIIVDFSFTRNVLLHLRSICASLYVIDHHRSAQDELNNLSFCTFDMNRSACQIVYDMLYDNQQPESRPSWINYIGNRDLWRFDTNDETDFFTTNLFYRTTYQSHLKVVEEISTYNPRQIHGCLQMGQTQKNFQSCMEHKSIQAAKKCKFMMPDQKTIYDVYVSDDYKNRSNIGSALSARSDCDFAVMYKFDLFRNQWHISLRGKEHKTSCLDVAKQFGGGGHQCAAAFSWNGQLQELLRVV